MSHGYFDSSVGQIVPDMQAIDEWLVRVRISHWRHFGVPRPKGDSTFSNACRVLIIHLDPTLQLEASAQQWILRLRYLPETSAS